MSGVWVLLFITIGQQAVIGEYKTKEACMSDRATYTKDAFRDEIFVCRMAAQGE